MHGRRRPALLPSGAALFPPTLPLPLHRSPPFSFPSLHTVRTTYTPFDYAATLLPCLRWLRGYRPKSLIWDLAAGASGAALVVPQ